MKQHTLKQTYTFSGKGLHSGLDSTITLIPAPENYGIQFLRQDLGADCFVKASVENVSSSTRNTTLKNDDAVVMTCEHLLSAMSALGVDNLLVKMNSPELPILDGSAKAYVQAILTDGIREQHSPRKFITIPKSYIYKDSQSDGEIAFYPSERFEVFLTTDFSSKVLGVQQTSYTEDDDYATEIAPCRTFCFFHELEMLASQGLVKGGDIHNAIVVVEHPVDTQTLEKMSILFGVSGLAITNKGYLNNLQLHFPDECGRHKLLDLIGDLSLAGAPLKARVVARKTGHRLNAEAVKFLLNNIKNGK